MFRVSLAADAARTWGEVKLLRDGLLYLEHDDWHYRSLASLGLLTGWHRPERQHLLLQLLGLLLHLQADR